MIKVKHLFTTALVAFSMLGAPLVMAQTPQGPAQHHKPMMDEGQRVEQHIAHLHDALKVTAQQEDQWKPVAQTIRDNEKTVHEVVKEKRSKIDTQTAAEDLVAYSEIAEAHAVASRKLADVFGTFYASMSDDQKKVADNFFREHKRRNGHPSVKHQ